MLTSHFHDIDGNLTTKFLGLSKGNFRSIDNSFNDHVKPCYDLLVNGLSYLNEFSANLMS